MYAYMQDCIAMFPIFPGDYCKNGYSIENNYSMDSCNTSIQSSFDLFLDVGWFASCLNRQKVNDLRRSLSLLPKSLLWLYWIFEYRYQIYRIHGALNEYESLKESDQCYEWFWFYLKNRDFRYFWTCHFSQILDSTQLCIFY